MEHEAVVILVKFADWTSPRGLDFNSLVVSGNKALSLSKMRDWS